MKTRITKQQTNELLRLKANIPIEEITPYAEVLESHAYALGDVLNGKMYNIYSNLSIGDLLNRITPIIPYNDMESAYEFDISQKNGKWVTKFTDKINNKDFFVSQDCDELIDAIFEAYCFVLDFF